MANSTEKVTVPMSWYFPSRYDGSFLKSILQMYVISTYYQILTCRDSVHGVPVRVQDSGESRCMTL